MKLISLTTPIDLATGAVESINFTIQTDGELRSESIAFDHPSFADAQARIADFQAGTLSRDELAVELESLANLSGKAAEKIATVQGILNGRMTLENGQLFIDGDRMDTALETYILRLLREDGTARDAGNWRAFANFVEKLYSNQSAYVREQFFGWLQYENLHGEGFTLTPEGDVIGYKGCAGTTAAPTSINSGTAVVNGVRHTGRIPNPMGAVVEMPRSQVQNDPSIGCSTGLHIGTYSYASGFSSGVLLKVKFSPADVVSVPVECNAQKIRACRYTVLEVTEGPDSGLVYGDEDLDDDFDGEEYCPDCGEAADSGECDCDCDCCHCEDCGEYREDCCCDEEVEEVEERNTAADLLALEAARDLGAYVSFRYANRTYGGKVDRITDVFWPKVGLDSTGAVYPVADITNLSISYKPAAVWLSLSSQAHARVQAVKATFEAAKVKGLPVEFSYDGAPRDAALLVEFKGRNVLVERDGEFRTYALAKITDAKVATDPKLAALRKAVEAAKAAKRVATFAYRGSDRKVTEFGAVSDTTFVARGAQGWRTYSLADVADFTVEDAVLPVKSPGKDLIARLFEEVGKEAADNASPDVQDFIRRLMGDK